MRPPPRPRPLLSSLVQQRSSPQHHRPVLPFCDFVSRLGHALKHCRISPAPPLHPAAFPRSDLRAEVRCSLTGKSPSPRLSLSSRSPIRRETLPAPHKGCSGVAPFHLPKRATREALVISVRGGSKSVEELGQGRWGLVTEKLL